MKKSFVIGPWRVAAGLFLVVGSSFLVLCWRSQLEPGRTVCGGSGREECYGGSSPTGAVVSGLRTKNKERRTMNNIGDYPLFYLGEQFEVVFARQASRLEVIADDKDRNFRIYGNDHWNGSQRPLTLRSTSLRRQMSSETTSRPHPQHHVPGPVSHRCWRHPAAWREQ